MTYVYQGSVKSEISTVCALIDQITTDLKPILGPDMLFDVKLVLSELMINSCEHGNANNSRKAVKLDLKVDPGTARIAVSDEGRGFQYDQKSFNPLDMKCSGRGLKIVSELCDSMQVQNSTVTCVIHG